MPNDLCGLVDVIEGRPLAASVYGLLSRYFSGGHRGGSQWAPDCFKRHLNRPYSRQSPLACGLRAQA
jgi:hypothetical protein